MTARKVDPAIAGLQFSDFQFEWDWTATQLIARAAGCSIDLELDRLWMHRDSDRSGHPMIAFNGAILARNRPEVMERLIGGYDMWQEVGRWGSSALEFHPPVPRRGHGRVSCGFTDVGATSKGHALVRFAFEVSDVPSGRRLANGWMLLFLLGCAPESASKISSRPIPIPQRDPDCVVHHDTPVNTTFDWAMPSNDWNATHFDRREQNPAPLVHGPRNMALVLHDAARAFAGGALERIRGITLGSLPSPHYPLEPTQTQVWKSRGSPLVHARLIVPGSSRRDGGSVDKVVIDQIELSLDEG